ncbi:MAG: MBOAT family protein, partial [Lachnospiraceae bacterium]|nr:MBOAT family protein [Lachnospiraceae bacterium]
VCGFCEILGIKLTENFNRPYFSKSIAEYWRRWLITLGVWFKTYIYYPVAMLKCNQRLGRWAKKKFQKHGKMIGDTLPATISLVVV